MKKALSLILALLMLIPLAAFGTSAADTVDTVYVSDNGSDQNDGLTATTPVKTLSKAMSLFPVTGGTVIITDKVSTPNEWYLPRTTGGAAFNANVTIKGLNEDGSSTFVQARSKHAIRCNYTFDNLTYELKGANYSLCTNYRKLEFTDSVKMKAFNSGVENYESVRQNYLVVYGGLDSSAVTGNTNLVLNGGTFNYIIGACGTGALTGNVNVTVGGTAKILNRVYAGGSGAAANVSGNVNITVNGGTIVDSIYLGGSSAGSNVAGNAVVTVNGGKIGGIVGRGVTGATLSGTVTLNLENYAPSMTDAFAKTLVDIPANAVVKTASFDKLAGYGTQTALIGDGTYAVRFVSTLKGLDFEAAGYEISVAGEGVEKEPWDVNSTVVYSSIYYTDGDGEAQPITAAEGEYFHTVSVNKISIEKYDDLTFTFKPYVLIDGVKYYGSAYTVVFNDGARK